MIRDEREREAWEVLLHGAPTGHGETMTPEEMAARLAAEWFGNSLSLNQMKAAIAAAIHAAVARERQICLGVASRFCDHRGNPGRIGCLGCEVQEALRTRWETGH